MVAGPDVYICDRCIHDASGIVRGDLQPYVVPPRRSGRADAGGTPASHDAARAQGGPRRARDRPGGRAKRALAVAVYNHYKRIEAEDYLHAYDDVELEKSNILLLGPKWDRARRSWRGRSPSILDVPFSIADATALTEAGYVGEDVESILSPPSPVRRL